MCIRITMNNRSIYVLIWTILLLLVSTASAEKPDSTVSSLPKPITSSEEAFNTAMQYFGITKDSPVWKQTESDYIVSTVVLSDTGTRFFKSHVNGRVAWQTTLPSLYLGKELIGRIDHPNSLKTFTIRIDSVTGNLLEVRAKVVVEHETPPKRPPWNEAGREMVFNSEQFKGLPSSVPEITLLDALKKVKGGAHPSLTAFLLYM